MTTSQRIRTAREDGAEAADVLHPTVKSILRAAQLAEQRMETMEDTRRETSALKANSHLTGREAAEAMARDGAGTAAAERGRRRAQRRHRGSWGGGGSDELDDWLAQAETERWQCELWGAPEGYLAAMTVASDDPSEGGRHREERQHEGSGGTDTTCDVWAAASRGHLDANLLFCPDTRFTCFVRARAGVI